MFLVCKKNLKVMQRKHYKAFLKKKHIKTQLQTVNEKS